MGTPTPHPGMPPRFVTGVEFPGGDQVVIRLECGHKFQYALKGLEYVAYQGPQGMALFLNCAHCAAPRPTR